MESPEVIYFNGEVQTLDKADNIYKAIAVKQGKIIAVGSDDTICGLQSTETILVNLNKRTVIPGFIDAHLHLFPLGFNLSNVDCHLESIEGVVEAVKERATRCESEEDWIIGWGFDESLYKEARKLNKWDFKDVKNPVYITRYCLHEAVVNEQALQKAGITQATEINNGTIERNENGEATGLLIEKAMSFIENVLPTYTEKQMKTAIELANEHVLKRGITSAHDAGLGFFDDPYREFDVLRKMAQDGTLNVKMYLMILAEFFTEFTKKHRDFKSEQLKIGSMKLFADGTLSGKNAAMIAPYKDSEERGMLLHTDDELADYVSIAHDMDQQVAIHGIGDRSIDQVLRIYEAVQEKYPRKNARHRIEHAIITNDDLLQRMAALDVIPIPQPTIMHMAGDVHTSVVQGKTLKYFALQSFIEKGLYPAGSSDSPVVDCYPILGIYAAMERKTVQGKVLNEDERITLKEAVKMYTVNAAYAAFEEHIKGTIEVNKCADFTILPADFMHYSADQVKETKVEMTVINGRILYER